MDWSRRNRRPPPPDWPSQRARMVRRDLAGRDIDDRRVLDAMGAVRREAFVPADKRALAYADHALPIGHRATISQPYIVALTLQLARPKPGDRLLEVGTGCGYAAAVASHVVARVYTMEIVEALATSAQTRLAEMGYRNVLVRNGDGSHGWPEMAPFNVILAAAAPREVPEALLAQLAPGGRAVLPVGGWRQRLWVFSKGRDGVITRRKAAAVTFVPMTGAASALPGAD